MFVMWLLLAWEITKAQFLIVSNHDSIYILKDGRGDGDMVMA